MNLTLAKKRTPHAITDTVVIVVFIPHISELKVGCIFSVLLYLSSLYLIVKCLRLQSFCEQPYYTILVFSNLSAVDWEAIE